jgi:hypothetical protein
MDRRRCEIAVNRYQMPCGTNRGLTGLHNRADIEPHITVRAGIAVGNPKRTTR